MRAAHQRLGIQQRDFDTVAAHLVAELGSHGVHSELIAEVVAAIAPLADQIVTDSHELPAESTVFMGSSSLPSQGGGTAAAPRR